MGLLGSLFSSSKNSSTTNQQTTNNYDQRQVNDAGGGVIGTGNVLDNSTSMSYAAFTDSRDLSQSFTDFSNRSTTDSRDQSVRISTDGGAFDVVRSVADGLRQIGVDQTAAARDIALRADTAGSNAMTFAIKAQESAAGFNELAAGRAFDLARSTSTQAFASSGEALGFTRDTFGKVVDLAQSVIGQAGTQAAQVASTANAAYASASDTSSGNKTLLYAGIAAVALVGIVAVARAFKG